MILVLQAVLLHKVVRGLDPVLILQAPLLLSSGLNRRPTEDPCPDLVLCKVVVHPRQEAILPRLAASLRVEDLLQQATVLHLEVLLPAALLPLVKVHRRQVLTAPQVKVLHLLEASPRQVLLAVMVRRRLAWVLLDQARMADPVLLHKVAQVVSHLVLLPRRGMVAVRLPLVVCPRQVLLKDRSEDSELFPPGFFFLPLSGFV